MARTSTDERLRRPEIILSDLLKSAARGEVLTTDHNPRILHRAVVLAVDVEGGLLENETGTGSIVVVDRSGRRKDYPASIGPVNPRGSIRARILTRARDRLEDDDQTDVYWPVFSAEQLALPVSVGEHVYVLFEDEDFGHGLWLSRVAGQDAANSFEGKTSYTLPTTRPSATDMFVDRPARYPQDDGFAGERSQSAADLFRPKG